MAYIDAPEQATLKERAERIAIHRLAAKGMLTPEQAFKMQRMIANQISADGRGGYCAGRDLHMAMGAGARHLDPIYQELNVLALETEKRLIDIMDLNR